MTRLKLITLNPILTDRPAKEVDDLLRELDEASYDWSPLHSAFVNTKLGKAIPVDTLHRFDARSIREWWGNEEFVTENDQLKSLTKIGCLCILSVPAAILVCFVWDWKIGLGLAAVGILALIVSDSRKKKILTAIEKREGRWVDRSKIQWCKNCVHFRKVRKWEDSRAGLWAALEAPQPDLLPCGISEETAEVWREYFSIPCAERAMYPKDCPKIKIEA